MPHVRSLGLTATISTVCLLAGLAACGGSSDEADELPAGAGASGAAGTGGGAAGKAGAGGGTAGGGAAGVGGAGKAGQGGGGTAGAAGGTGGASGGTGGGSGASGKGGGGGASGAGAGGTAGKGGAQGGCSVDADCTASLPPTTPAGCAQAKCDTKTKTCVFSAKDADGDGHGTNKCKSNDGVTAVIIGDDCDDTDPSMFPGAWDGPKGDGHPDKCDSIDQDCDGVADDEKLKDGSTCTCAPGDVKPCSEDSSGKPIAWPTGKPAGACKYGSKTCLANGTYGPCTGAVPPSQESCNHIDDDCNGIVDDGPPPDNVPVDAVYFAYDGDNDQHGLVVGNGYALVHACSFNPPQQAPLACTQGSLAGCSTGTTADECCPPTAWKFAAALQSDDCNDQNPKVNPLAPEICDTIDNDCDGKVDTACICTPNAVDTSCAATPNGNPISFPGGSPQGACSYGSRTCSSDGKSWGPCTGAISPAASDDCITAGGVDTDCDGSISCSCSPLGDVRACANQKGSCAGATQTCGASGYGACTIVPAASDTCDAGNDDTCNGVPNEGCAHVNGTPCGDPSTCNVGVWTNCDSSGACVCSGGAPIAPVVFCYDGDSDFYCDLSKTQSVCANAPTQPVAPWRPLSTAACTSAGCTDCNDGDAAIHPNAFESCNGVDANCNGTVNDGCGCQNGTTKSCGSAAQCNQGAIQTCVNGAYGACSIPPVLNAGTNCGGAGAGACAALDSAQWVCTGPSTGAANCTYISTVSTGATYHTTGYPANGSFDWSCDGTASPQYTSSDSDFWFATSGNCTNYANFCSQIDTTLVSGINHCNNWNHFLTCLNPCCGGCVFTGTCSPPGCGGSMTQVHCKYNGTSCVYDASQPAATVKMPCK